jgi:hypothetical protein
MLITFEVGGAEAEFHWNNMTGSAVVKAGGSTTRLEDPKNPSTHFHAGTRRAWKCQIDGHDIEIIKVRPLFFAPFRPNHFTVSVDGVVVSDTSGR